MGAPILSQDHQGKWYDSIMEMCDYWDIDDKKYHRRRKAGYSVESALTGAGIDQNIKPSRDHLGQLFPSESAMCKAHGIADGTYRGRIRKGWSVYDALTNQPKKRLHGQDHIGITRRMNNGMIATIISYTDSQHMKIAFEDGVVVSGSYGNFNKGCIGHKSHRKGECSD